MSHKMRSFIPPRQQTNKQACMHVCLLACVGDPPQRENMSDIGLDASQLSHVINAVRFSRLSFRLLARDVCLHPPP